MWVKRCIRKALTESERLGLRARRSALQKYKLGRTIVDCILLPSDIAKIFRSFKAAFGIYPNLIVPNTFNEYLQQSKLLNRKRVHTQWADKLLVRDYVAEKIGRQYLNALIWSGDDLRSVDVDNLPERFIIKANHGSGTNIVVQNKRVFDWQAAYHATSQWLKADFSIPFGEWEYRWIKPKLVIEELLVGEYGQVPLDYKFFVFGGSVKFVQVDFDRFSNHTRNIYDENFRKLDVEFHYSIFKGDAEKPRCFDEMIGLAEKLSNQENFVRVDLYDIGRPIFGEITLHPEAGLGKFNPQCFDRLLGELWAKGGRPGVLNPG
jgi:hypothetical protein